MSASDSTNQVRTVVASATGVVVLLTLSALAVAIFFRDSMVILRRIPFLFVTQIGTCVVLLLALLMQSYIPNAATEAFRILLFFCTAFNSSVLIIRYALIYLSFSISRAMIDGKEDSMVGSGGSTLSKSWLIKNRHIFSRFNVTVFLASLATILLGYGIVDYATQDGTYSKATDVTEGLLCALLALDSIAVIAIASQLKSGNDPFLLRLEIFLCAPAVLTLLMIKALILSNLIRAEASVVFLLDKVAILFFVTCQVILPLVIGRQAYMEERYTPKDAPYARKRQFKLLLLDAKGNQLFLQYLQDEFCVENVLFLNNLKLLEKFEYSTNNYKNLFETFILPQGDLALNISCQLGNDGLELYKRLTESKEQCDETLKGRIKEFLGKVEDTIVDLLIMGPFLRFRQTDVYDKWAKECIGIVGSSSRADSWNSGSHNKGSTRRNSVLDSPRSVAPLVDKDTGTPRSVTIPRESLQLAKLAAIP